MTGPETALVALDELVVHGWDVARASGQEYRADAASLAGTEQFVSAFSARRWPRPGTGCSGRWCRCPTRRPRSTG